MNRLSPSPKKSPPPAALLSLARTFFAAPRDRYSAPKRMSQTWEGGGVLLEGVNPLKATVSAFARGGRRDVASWYRCVWALQRRLTRPFQRSSAVLNHLQVADILRRGNRCPKPWVLIITRRSRQAKLQAAHAGVISPGRAPQTLVASLPPASTPGLLDIVVASHDVEKQHTTHQGNSRRYIETSANKPNASPALAANLT